MAETDGATRAGMRGAAVRDGVRAAGGFASGEVGRSGRQGGGGAGTTSGDAASTRADTLSGNRDGVDVGRAHAPASAPTARASSAPLVIGMACLWAWGYVATLSQSLFPAAGVVASIGIEYAYYVSQVVLLVLGMLAVAVLRRWRPVLPPGAVVGAAVLLSAATLAVSVLMRMPGRHLGALAACGLVYGACGFVLTVAWGAHASAGPARGQRLVLLSFLGAYGAYLVSTVLPLPVARVLAIALPVVSGALWYVDTRRRHLATAQVWPTEEFEGEASAGSVGAAILPWRTLSLLAVACLVGNFASAFIMGETYGDAMVIFVGGFAVSALLVLATLPLVGDGSRRFAVERVYRYVLPVAALGMLAATVGPASWTGACGAVLEGAGIFMQSLVILKVCEATRETGVSPMLSFGVGQGLIGGMVVFGNVAGRLAAGLDVGGSLLGAVCAVGVFVLFYLLVMMVDGLAGKLDAAGIPLEALSARVPEAERELVTGEVERTVGKTRTDGTTWMGGVVRTTGVARPDETTWTGDVTRTDGVVRVYASSPGDPATVVAHQSSEGAGASDGPVISTDTAPATTENSSFASEAALDATWNARLVAFADLYCLTPREADVLAQLMRGRTLAAIADRLYVTAGTVKTHVLHIYRKAAVNSRQELMDLFDAMM